MSTKVRFFCNSGANAFSTREEIVEVEDWDNLTEEEKYKEAEQWASERLEIGFEEIDT